MKKFKLEFAMVLAISLTTLANQALAQPAVVNEGNFAAYTRKNHGTYDLPLVKMKDGGLAIAIMNGIPGSETYRFIRVEGATGPSDKNLERMRYRLNLHGADGENDIAAKVDRIKLCKSGADCKPGLAERVLTFDTGTSTARAKGASYDKVFNGVVGPAEVTGEAKSTPTGTPPPASVATSRDGAAQQERVVALGATPSILIGGASVALDSNTPSLDRPANFTLNSGSSFDNPTLSLSTGSSVAPPAAPFSAQITAAQTDADKVIASFKERAERLRKSAALEKTQSKKDKLLADAQAADDGASAALEKVRILKGKQAQAALVEKEKQGRLNGLVAAAKPFDATLIPAQERAAKAALETLQAAQKQESDLWKQWSTADDKVHSRGEPTRKAQLLLQAQKMQKANLGLYDDYLAHQGQLLTLQSQAAKHETERKRLTTPLDDSAVRAQLDAIKQSGELVKLQQAEVVRLERDAVSGSTTHSRGQASQREFAISNLDAARANVAVAERRQAQLRADFTLIQARWKEIDTLRANGIEVVKQ